MTCKHGDRSCICREFGEFYLLNEVADSLMKSIAVGGGSTISDGGILRCLCQ